MTKETIINDIEKHLANSVKQYYSDFYVGITNDVNRRLFGEHNVDKDMSVENAAIMGEICSLRNDIDKMQRINMRDKSRRIINEECRSEEPVAIRMSPYDVRRKRTDFRPFSLNGEKGKDE